MVAAHVLSGLAQRFDDGGVSDLLGGFVLGLRHEEVLRLVVDPVDEMRVADDGGVALAAHIADDLAHELGSRHVAAERLLVSLADLRAELDLIKGCLRQHLLNGIFSDFTGFYDFHLYFLAFHCLSHLCRSAQAPAFACCSSSRILRSSSVSWLMRSNFSLKLTRLTMRRAVASRM